MSSHSSAEASTEHSFVETLREMNEVRMAWVVSPRTRHKIMRRCAEMGVWGILSGYAVFFLLWEEGKDKPLTFAIGLLVAVVVAFIAESMRELIQHGRMPGQGSGAGPRIVVTILMLAVFELFVMAYHEASGIRKPTLGHLRAGVLGPVLSHERTAWWDVGAMVGLWVIVGGVVAWQLTSVIVRATGRRSQRVRFGVKVGGRAALVAAPLGVLAYVLVARAIGSIAAMTTRYGEWERNLYNILENEHIPAMAKMAVLPVSLLNKLSHLPVFGPAIVVLLILGLVFWCRMSRKWVPLVWLGAGGIIVMAAPLLIDDKGFESLLWLPLLAAIIWGVPGVVLGGIAPLLERPSQEPRKWGLIAYLSAAFLLCLTVLRLMYPGFLIPASLANPWVLGSAAVLLIATGILFYRSSAIEDYWPLVALCVAMIICGSMLILQQATFLGVLGNVHAVNNLPDVVPGKIDLPKLIQISLKTFTPPPEHDLEELSEQIKASNDLSWDRQLVQTRELLRQVEEKLNAAEKAAWRSALGPSEPVHSPLFPESIRSDFADINALYEEMEPLLDWSLQEQLGRGEELLKQIDEKIEAIKEAWRRKMLQPRPNLYDHMLDKEIGALSNDIAALKTKPPEEQVKGADELLRKIDERSRMEEEAQRGAAPESYMRWERLLPERLGEEQTEQTPAGTIGLPQIGAANPFLLRRLNPKIDRLRTMQGEVEEIKKNPVQIQIADPDPALLSYSYPEGLKTQRLQAMKQVLADKLHEVSDEITRQEQKNKAKQGHEEATQQCPCKAAEEASGKTTEQSPPKTAKHKSSFYAVPPPSLLEHAMGVPSSYRAKRRVLSLQEMKETLEEREEHLEVLIHWQQTVAQSLELAITGSLGFWVTVGLLAGWSILKHQNPIVTSPDGRPRCFWAKGYWQRYHDEQHGVIPASDRELFERLCLEILLGDDERKWKGQVFLHEVFHGFVPETVAELTREDIKQAVGQQARADERLALDNQELVGMVIENAQRLQMFYRLQSQPNLDSTSAVLLRSWQVRGQQGQQEQDLAAFISHVRSFFRIPESTPLGTFLQAVGLLQGAHFGGCFLHQELGRL